MLAPFAASSPLSAAALSVSPSWVALHDYFVMLRAIVGKCLSPLAIPVVLSACFEELLSALLDDGQWGQLTLGYGGLLQLTRDVSFFTHAVHTFETEQSHRLAQQLLQRARRDYTRLTKAKEDEVEQAQDRQEGELATRMEGPMVQPRTLSAVEEEERRSREAREAKEAKERKERSSGAKAEERKAGGGGGGGATKHRAAAGGERATRPRDDSKEDEDGG